MVRAAATNRATSRAGAVEVPRSAVPESAAPVDVDEIVSEIGPKVHALRSELGLSLQQMGALADVSAASIHKIERGEMVPTITTLLKLATAFHRPVSYLINESPGDPNDVSFTARGAGATAALKGGGEARTISGPNVRFRSQASISTVPPGFTQTESATRPGEEMLYVLTGTLDVEVDDRHFTVRRGDALHYLTDRSLSWSNRGKQSVEVLRVTFRYS
jgi:DNA-binding XRE family transcriptional regulator/mannose-6-phosphate isomerase-like protein (cupin superfamily)